MVHLQGMCSFFLPTAIEHQYEPDLGTSRQIRLQEFSLASKKDLRETQHRVFLDRGKCAEDTWGRTAHPTRGSEAWHQRGPMPGLVWKEEDGFAQWRTLGEECKQREQQVQRGSVKGLVHPGEGENFRDKAHARTHVHVYLHVGDYKGVERRMARDETQELISPLILTVISNSISL